MKAIRYLRAASGVLGLLVCVPLGCAPVPALLEAARPGGEKYLAALELEPTVR